MRPAAAALVAALALAGGIHLAVGVDHGPSGLHGAFFLGTGALQAGLAVALARRRERRLLVAALLVSVGVIGVWAATRGVVPAAGREPVGQLDLAATVLEAGAVVLAAGLLRRPAAVATARRRRPAAIAAGIVLATVVATPLAAAPGHVHDDRPSRGAEAQETGDEPSPVFGDLFEGHGGPGGHAGAPHSH